MTHLLKPSPGPGTFVAVLNIVDIVFNVRLKKSILGHGRAGEGTTVTHLDMMCLEACRHIRCYQTTFTT